MGRHPSVLCVVRIGKDKPRALQSQFNFKEPDASWREHFTFNKTHFYQSVQLSNRFGELSIVFQIGFRMQLISFCAFGSMFQTQIYEIIRAL